MGRCTCSSSRWWNGRQRGAALRQLQERDYAAKYRGRGAAIHLIGVEFSREKRNVVAFEVERA